MKKQKIYSDSDVYRATRTRELGKPVFQDVRGVVNRLNVGGQRINVHFTKKGFMRGGDLHPHSQFCFVFSGKVEVSVRKGNKDLRRVYKENDCIEIPAHTPHLFKFVRDTVMAEWWGGPLKVWYYKPYREIIEKQMKEARKKLNK